MCAKVGEVREDHERLSAAGFTVVVGAAGLLATTIYRQVFEELIKLMLTELYSYLIVALLTVSLVLYHALRAAGLSYEFRVSKVLVSILLASLGVVLYLGAHVDPTYSLQLGTTSFVLVFLSLITLVYSPRSIGDVAPLLSIFTLIPIPAELAESATPAISRLTGSFISAFTGYKLIENFGNVKIEVSTPQGPALLDLQAACAGVLTISSVLVIVPVLTYLVAFSSRNWLRRVVSVAISIAVALAVGVVGNLVRVFLVIINSSRVGMDLGIDVLKATPSAIFSLLSVLASFLVAVKLGGIDISASRAFRAEPNIRRDFVSGVLAIAVILATAYQVVCYVTTPNPFGVGWLAVEASDVENFVDGVPSYVLDGARLVSYSYNPYLTELLDALRTYEISAVLDGERYEGYVEVVDTPARLRPLSVCLSTKGYRILNSWYTTANSTSIHFIEIEKDGVRGVLAYIVTPAYVKTPSKALVMYLRISLIRTAQESSSADMAGDLIRALRSITRGSLIQQSREELRELAWWATASYVLLASLVVYFIAVLSYPILGKLRKLFSF